MKSYLQLLLLLLTTVSSVVYCQYDVPSSLSGDWVNELGSTMKINSQSAAPGQLTGWYCSAVIRTFYCWYPLTGRFDTNGSERDGTLGWTVSYKNVYGNVRAAGAWSGQRQLTEDMLPIIITTSIMTNQTNPKYNWNASTIKKSIFWRSSGQTANQGPAVNTTSTANNLRL